MNLERVIGHVAQRMQEADAPLFLIGGLAMHAYDSTRLTTDVDFLTRDDQRDGIVSFMEKSGYETLHRGDGFSNHLHPDEEWGRVDFVYPSVETVGKMLDASTTRVRIADFELPVPSPEHLIAMKVLAMKNEPRRTLMMELLKSHSEPLDLEDGFRFSDEDRAAMWKAHQDSMKMSTPAYLRWLSSFPRREPDRTVRGIPGDQLEL